MPTTLISHYHVLLPATLPHANDPHFITFEQLDGLLNMHNFQKMDGYDVCDSLATLTRRLCVMYVNAIGIWWECSCLLIGVIPLIKEPAPSLKSNKSGMQTMPKLVVLLLVYMSGEEFTMKHDPAFEYYTNSCMTWLFGLGGISQDNRCTLLESFELPFMAKKSNWY